jgi:protein-disulfide isomerase/uncharacterized membrane protein
VACAQSSPAIATVRRSSPALVVAGAVFAGIGALASLLLVLEHLGGLSLPGCGEGGACTQAADSFWGAIRIGGFEWPVSYLGLAYFFAALATWLVMRGTVPRGFRYLVRLGALASLGFCVLILTKWMICPYCIMAHLGNFAFWVVVEMAAGRPAGLQRAAITLGSAFAVATLALGIWDAQEQAAVRARAEQERSAAEQEIIARSHQPLPQTATLETAESRGTPAETAASQPVSAANSEQTETPETPPGAAQAATASPTTQAGEEEVFTGRYRVGPAEAPIRLVLFTDYQCQDCYRIEKQLVRLWETRHDISISIKHFPFNTDCNPCARSTLHPNACWAARAAEAAGRLWGPEGFWKMHRWLFERRGVFETTEELEKGIRDLGYDPAGFVEEVKRPETLEAIKADATEARRLGLFFTPMIFINGVELKGWMAPNALVRTVEQVAATNPPARSAAYDQPPAAFDKYVADWRDERQIKLPPDQQAWAHGPADAKVDIVLWGDYQETGTTVVDGVIRTFAAGRNDVRYTYRHFPFNSDCNPQLKDQRFPKACLAAKAAEAAGLLGGEDGHWKMHVWLMEHREELSEETLRAAVTELGFDADALLAAVEKPEVAANIEDDIKAAQQLPQLRWGLPAGLHEIPTIFVNGRHVPRWRLNDQPVLEEILREAAK